LLAVGTEDGLLELRRLAIDAAGRVTDTPLQNPTWVKRGSVRALAFSPDGHILVFGTDNGSVGVVVTPDRSSEWQESQLIFAHRMGVTALQFCGAPSAETQQGIGRRMCDHNTFVSTGNDGRVKFWQMNRENGTQKIQPRQTLEGPNAEVLSVALNPDEGLVAAGDAIGQLHVWRLDQEPTIENICRALHRNLSWQEWLQYVGDKLSYECTCPTLPPGWDVDSATLKHAVDCPR